MAIVNCKDCRNEISSEARRCPNCGRPLKRIITAGRFVAVLVCILLVVAALQAQRRANDAIAADQAQYDELMARVGRTPESGIDRINDQVAQDAVDQYWIAKRQGDAVQICAQASLVVAGFLQAKNEKKYVHWKDVEEMDCRIANSQ